MRRGTLRSFLGGLVLGTILGALATWLRTSQQQPIPPALRERARTLLQQARAQGEQAVTTLRTQLLTARQAIESRIAGTQTPGERTETTASDTEVAVEAES
ncbi:hypothetical protein OO015_06860 [Thermomicrobium sp. 4228-Ro]|uniref:hypothetical protein n=1 Tax=Thermomicrobium sp. 4228-Ro TaxID=2993937 RepID=UPI002248D34C|nr:hypothetical protein [Thermomicrobium sp. 4228-Ro]MCX2727216.1 hypothetical protein [Thermomicrobium sp. 4228-Ro]